MDLSSSACCAAGERGYGIAQSATKRPRKSPLANPSACGPVKSSSSASLISFCRWISASFINSRRQYALKSVLASRRAGFAENQRLQIARARGTRSWILPRLTTDNFGEETESRQRLNFRNVKRDRAQLMAVHRQIDRIFAGLRETQLLNDHDEMRREIGRASCREREENAK